MGPLVSIVLPFRDTEVGPIIVVIKKHRLSVVVLLYHVNRYTR